MDSVTHLFYGGVIAAAIAPRQDRRAALLAGMALNTLPDLDVLPLLLSDDPVVRMTCHRAATHSWLVLPLVAWAIWAFLRRRGGRVARAPVRWWWAIFACLMAHPLLDSFTIYGTQLLWPLPVRPLMWGSLFIVDPLFTLPWLLAFAVAWVARDRPLAKRALLTGMMLGVGYLGWSLAAKFAVERAAARSLATLGLADAPRFSVPMPFTTLLWQVTAMTPTGFVTGERSLVADRGPMHFTAYQSDTQALRAVAGWPVVQRLAWFNHGFMKAQVRDDLLVLSDLRMGLEPDYTFNFAVARREGGQWRPLTPPKQLRYPWQATRRLPEVWERIWRASAGDQAASGSSGDTPAASAAK
ncbi:MAG: metal-dependent hydrolase [Thermomonas hydrothermalis]|uniref:metal-dependent hydrolase n=1 Tax=Thermomonas hydrothermalis TaxID=213588 RepID=UPI0023538379|nr:metal-dependent hydrolase [Thermomonas hydrothermalis]MCL6619212.1 metal-dependent hydrolase [Thermomonas hydrothermalis]